MSSTRKRTIVAMAALATLLSGLATSSAEATPPGNNGLIAYSSNPTHTEADIWVTDATGSVHELLIADPNVVFSDPAWSPDGSQLAYERVAGSGTFDIYVADANGTNQRCLICDDAAHDLDPAWSPDGSRIAYGRSTDLSTYEIWIADVASGIRTRLSTGTSYWERHPDWSPDGTKIAFGVRGDDAQHTDIFVIDVDGTNRVNLTDRILSDDQPSWSPDGTRIAFESQRDYETGNYDIYVMDADGSNVERITTTSNEDTQPAWSPDGSTIAFVTQVDNDPGQPIALGPMNLAVVDVTTRVVSQLTDSEAYDYGPGWQPAVSATPQDQIVALKGAVVDLREDGDITRAAERSLNRRLDRALGYLDRGDLDRTCWALQAFTRRVTYGENRGWIPADAAGLLRGDADAIRGALGCPGA